MKNERQKKYRMPLISQYNTESSNNKNAEKRLNKDRHTSDTIHMTIHGIYTVRSTDMFDLSPRAAMDICVLLATLARACATAASNSRTSSIKCLFSRMNIMRSTLHASILLRRSSMRSTSAGGLDFMVYNRAINASYGISTGDVTVLVVGHTLSVPRQFQNPRRQKASTSSWPCSATYTNTSRLISTRRPVTAA